LLILEKVTGGALGVECFDGVGAELIDSYVIGDL